MWHEDESDGEAEKKRGAVLYCWNSKHGQPTFFAYSAGDWANVTDVISVNVVIAVLNHIGTERFDAV